MISKKAFAFTMAEILISLTIIGVIAAITLPSLKANINEKAWAAQRKALYSRMSQAIDMMPSITGYGVGATQAETNDKAALAFVTDGLNKVLKINNICNYENIANCGIPSQITAMNGSKKDFPTDLHSLNKHFTEAYSTQYWNASNPQSHVNTKIAAFETVNGESVAVFYNPTCLDEYPQNISQTSYNCTNEYRSGLPVMCANFVFDINGKKGPNTLGKDIEIGTLLFSTKRTFIMPKPLKEYKTTYPDEASQYCRNLGKDNRVPTVDEAVALKINSYFLSIGEPIIWTPESVIPVDGKPISSDPRPDGKLYLSVFNSGFIAYQGRRNDNNSTRCVKR